MISTFPYKGRKAGENHVVPFVLGFGSRPETIVPSGQQALYYDAQSTRESGLVHADGSPE